MRKVLLVGPSTNENINAGRWVTAPLGIHYIASWLNAHGHYAEVWDQNVDEDSYEERITAKKWHVIGFSVLEATKEYDMGRIHLAQQLSPGSLLIAGGYGASLDYQTFFEHSPLNIAILAEGELPILALCDMLDKYEYSAAPLHTIDGLVLFSRARQMTEDQYQCIRMTLNIEAMGNPRYWKKTAALYQDPNWNEVNTFRLNTSNYCPMNCSFCVLTNMRRYTCIEPGKVLALNARQTISLIERVIEHHPECQQIFFCDDDFLLSRKRGIEICEAIIASKQAGVIPAEMGFICLTNLNRIGCNNIDGLAQAGFKVISIGIESLSQHVLDSLGKKQKAEHVEEVTRLILSRGIMPYYSLILFTPYADMQDLIGDVKGFRRLGEMGVGLSIEHYLIPMHGTKFAEVHVQQRIRRVEIPGARDHIYKGFAWLPEDTQVRAVFDVFERIYPKLRKLRTEEAAGTHTEKKFQAYVLLEAAELALYSVADIKINPATQYQILLDRLYSMPDYNIDTVGSIK